MPCRLNSNDGNYPRKDRNSRRPLWWDIPGVCGRHKRFALLVSFWEQCGHCSWLNRNLIPVYQNLEASWYVVVVVVVSLRVFVLIALVCMANSPNIRHKNISVLMISFNVRIMNFNRDEQTLRRGRHTPTHTRTHTHIHKSAYVLMNPPLRNWRQHKHLANLYFIHVIIEHCIVQFYSLQCHLNQVKDVVTSRRLNTLSLSTIYMVVSSGIRIDFRHLRNVWPYQNILTVTPMTHWRVSVSVYWMRFMCVDATVFWRIYNGT